MQKTFTSQRLAVLAAASIAAAALATPASGWTDPTPEPFQMFRLFTPEAKLSADGRKLVVTGMADCGPAEGVVQVAVSVLQHATFAAARGFSAEQPCTDAEDTFTAELTVKEGKPAFTAGPVQACGMAQMRKEGGAPDYDFWCTFVTLVVDEGL
jgi:hypothetical protein